jgi:hypothetical protein
MPSLKASDRAKQAWSFIKYEGQGKGFLLDPALRGVTDQFGADVIETLAGMRRTLTSQRRFLPAENLNWWTQAYMRVIGGNNPQAGAVLKLIHKVVSATPSERRPQVIRDMILTPGKPEYETDRVIAKTKTVTPVSSKSPVVATVTDAGPNYEKIEESSGGSSLFWLAIGAGILASTL